MTKTFADAFEGVVTVQASERAQAESAAFSALIEKLRTVAPQHDTLALALEAAGSAYAVAYGEACFVVGVELAARPAALLLKDVD